VRFLRKKDLLAESKFGRERGLRFWVGREGGEKWGKSGVKVGWKGVKSGMEAGGSGVNGIGRE